MNGSESAPLPFNELMNVDPKYVGEVTMYSGAPAEIVSTPWLPLADCKAGVAKLGTLANISSRAAAKLPAGMVCVAWIGDAGKITIPFASLTGTGAPV